MKSINYKNQKGFSLLELLIGMAITLILLGVVSSILARAMGVREREGRKADALSSAQAALNVMSRDIGNAGFGIFTDSVSQTPSNGLIYADSNVGQIHLRSNFENVGDRNPGAGATVLSTNEAGEDITYFFDNSTKSIVRYDPNAPAGTPKTSVIVNKISNVTFEYFNYTSSSSTVTQTASPTSATGRVRLTVTVNLEQVVGQSNPESVTFSSDIALRNSSYMLRQY